jgi:hypothetical protein
MTLFGRHWTEYIIRQKDTAKDGKMTFELDENALQNLWAAINYLSMLRIFENEEDRSDVLRRAQYALTSFAVQLHQSSKPHLVLSYSSRQKQEYTPNRIAER